MPTNAARCYPHCRLPVAIGIAVPPKYAAQLERWADSSSTAASLDRLLDSVATQLLKPSGDDYRRLRVPSGRGQTID